MRISSALATAVALLAALAAAPGADAQSPKPVALKGAGASFPAPLYYKWSELFARENRNVTVTYDSVGSGDGIARFTAGTVDFGASDSAMTDAQIAKVERGVLLIPAAAGMVSVVYNLPGLTKPLQLPRDVYVDIFRGAITRWDDPRLKKANPGQPLPARNIALVTRLDRSGTTFAFTNHLSAASEVWKRERGVNQGVEWPSNAMLARGNEGVASRIKISEGAIGYAEYGFAKRLGLPMAALENKAGKFVQPGEPTGQAALAEAVPLLEKSMRAFIPDPAGANSYPITTFTWLLVYRNYPDAARKAAMRDFVTWGLSTGQKSGSDLGYFALPQPVLEKAREQLALLK
jgi:phosphate transport system substrate-binding protein